MVPKRFLARVLYLAHSPRLTGHPGGTLIYSTLRKDYYWLDMANDAFATLRNCASCAATRGTLFENQKDLKLFIAEGPPEFIAIDLFRLLLKPVHENQHRLVITDRFLKLPRSIPLRTTTASVVASAFLDNSVMSTERTIRANKQQSAICHEVLRGIMGPLRDAALSHDILSPPNEWADGRV